VSVLAADGTALVISAIRTVGRTAPVIQAAGRTAPVIQAAGRTAPVISLATPPQPWWACDRLSVLTAAL
jgi:hypothetical protein